MHKMRSLFAVPYALWLLLFVFAPVVLILGYSFMDINGHFTLANYQAFFSSSNYLLLTLNSFWYALLITASTLLLGYPAAYFLTRLKHRDFWLLLVILPTWISLLLKAYAFIGIFGIHGGVNQFLNLFGIPAKQILFTNFSFVFVSAYIELPFMIMPIYNSLVEIDQSLVFASYDLGANKRQTFTKVIWPLSLSGVNSGIQAIFIPSLSLFMLTRLIGGNRVITLGTAIEEHFLITQNWGMGATIGVVLIIVMLLVMSLTRERKGDGSR
ncbi:spermidine/putrescine ABC transporter permease protein [Ligilactobacillus salitolerans]|uniref:Spermidine/putrescine ABC transporter permease protein n=1 Tax=Ligilactobacillus salitolerans TaxID=1808352 RepID=A0A401IQG7_9LACO|nr:ABC transporter permease [Ligilactobacillus salitolerans]GBG93744.1 spermidine/putrescine ABC transporter permease protein [Ligilactobacillus salitolerans]